MNRKREFLDYLSDIQDASQNISTFSQAISISTQLKFLHLKENNRLEC